MPRLLSTIRDYFTNPMKYVTNLDSPSMGWGRLTFELPRLDQHLGIHELGSGHFSQVFPLNSKWVVKVDCNETDDAYEAWADYCMTDGRDNPYCPRIRLKLKMGQKTLYIIERLNPLGCTPEVTKVVEFGQALRFPGDYSAQQLRHDCPTLMRLVFDFGISNFRDVRRDNIMQREDGQIVLSDPCASFYGRGHGSENLWKRLTEPKLARGFGPVEVGGGRLRIHKFIIDAMKPAAPDQREPDLHELAMNAKRHRGHMHLIERQNHVRNRQRLR